MEIQRLFKKLEKQHGRLTCAKALKAWREHEEQSMSEVAKKLGISKSSYQWLEAGLRIPSPKRAMGVANKLNLPKITFTELAIRDSLYKNGLKYNVKLEAQ